MQQKNNKKKIMVIRVLDKSVFLLSNPHQVDMAKLKAAPKL